MSRLAHTGSLRFVYKVKYCRALWTSVPSSKCCLLELSLSYAVLDRPAGVSSCMEDFTVHLKTHTCFSGQSHHKLVPSSSCCCQHKDYCVFTIGCLHTLINLKLILYIQLFIWTGIFPKQNEILRNLKYKVEFLLGFLKSRKNKKT